MPRPKRKLTRAQCASRGGKAGTGDAKRRTREQCQRAALAMHANRRARLNLDIGGSYYDTQ